MKLRRVILAVAVSVALLAAPTVLTSNREQVPHAVVLSITEGPDPIGSAAPEGVTEGADPVGLVSWVPWHADGYSVLYGRDDRRPDVADAPENHDRTVVWALGVAGQYDVAVADFDGMKWGDPQRIAMTPQDELDPRVFRGKDGRTWVAWWVETPSGSEIWTARRELDGSWTTPQNHMRSGLKPSVAEFDGTTYLSWEQVDVAGTREIVLQIASPDGAVDYLTIAGSNRSAPLEAVVHAEDGRLWIDWQHSDTLMGYVELVDGRWAGSIRTLRWTQWDWEGIRQGRQAVRAHVLD